MDVIYAPEKYFVGERSCFLAGGITGCPDWQTQIMQMFEAKGLQDITWLNPRRPNFPMDDPGAAAQQIKWEHCALRDAGVVLFWFCKDTLCPIVLYELGAHSMTDKTIFIGVEPGYQRAQDVHIQTSLVRPDIHVVDSLERLADQVAAHFRVK